MIYIPYFRGKQYDLLGLTESVQNNLMTESVIPLIEPVRDSKYLKLLLQACIQRNRRLLIIVNPEVGQAPYGATLQHGFADYFHHELFMPVYILNDAFHVGMIQYEKYILLSKQYSKETAALADELNPVFHIISENPVLKMRISGKRVRLSDPFIRRSVYGDYMENSELDTAKSYLTDEQSEGHVADAGKDVLITDEFFSDDYKYLVEDGYIGCSDYGIDGEKYIDKGYPSSMVVLHVLYIDRHGSIRIKHFLSDSNESLGNPGTKFFEALRKLHEWLARNSAKIPVTEGLSLLCEYLHSGRYPGAGITKKLLVMHQMEILKTVTSEWPTTLPNTTLMFQDKTEATHAHANH